MRKAMFRASMMTVAIVAFGVARADADIIFSQDGGGTGDNVLFQCPDSEPDCYDDRSDLTQLVGTLNNGEYEVLFDADVGIKPGASGQATVLEINAATTWNSLDISWLNFFATDLVILKITPTTAGTDFQLIGTDDDGTLFTSQVFTGINPNSGAFFTYEAVLDQFGEPQQIVDVGIRVTSADGSIAEVLQVRLGEIFEEDPDDVEPDPVPEPAVLALFGVGLFTVGIRARRQKP